MKDRYIIVTARVYEGNPFTTAGETKPVFVQSYRVAPDELRNKYGGSIKRTVIMLTKRIGLDIEKEIGDEQKA